MLDLNVNYKYYTIRNLALESGEYYTVIKNQTLAQNSFYVLSVPKPVLQAFADNESDRVFSSKFFINADSGELRLYAGGEDGLYDGTWENVSVNGSSVLSDSTANPFILNEKYFGAGVSFVDGYNTVTGTFTLDSGPKTFSVTGYWTNSWENA